MDLLLDTHVLLWWLADDAGLGEPVRRQIDDPENRIFVSAVVAWEVSIKTALGKLRPPGKVSTEMEANGFHPLSVSVVHAEGVADLPPIHTDPFDRLLVSQAIAEGMTIVTRDPYILSYPVKHLKA